MKAAVLHGKSDLRIEQVPIPKIAPHEVLVEMKIAGIFKFNVSFNYTVEADEVIYVLKGCLVIIHEEKEYKAYKGDYMFLKKGTEANWGCEGNTEYFYATYPI